MREGLTTIEGFKLQRKLVSALSSVASAYSRLHSVLSAHSQVYYMLSIRRAAVAVAAAAAIIVVSEAAVSALPLPVIIPSTATIRPCRCIQQSCWLESKRLLGYTAQREFSRVLLSIVCLESVSLFGSVYVWLLLALLGRPLIGSLLVPLAGELLTEGKRWRR